MPELLDVIVHCEALESRLIGRTLHRIRVLNPFVPRSVAPPLDSLNGMRLRSVSRLLREDWPKRLEEW